jgi:hypothetical protein
MSTCGEASDALSTTCIIMRKDEALLIDKNINSYKTSGFPADIS